MILWTGPFPPLAALIWPLLLGALAALPLIRPVAVRLLPFAPAPALWLALAGEDGATAAPDLLLGVTLELDDTRRLLLGMTAVLWGIAGLAAQPMAGKPHMATFSGFWCLVLAGNLGVFLAGDVVTFYVSFAAVSLASWFLVVHERTETAMRAGRVYIVVALAGEVALLIGFIFGVDAAQSMHVAEIRAALGDSGSNDVAIALLALGFGIKAGLVPLHVWLPLAHTAAPAPGSAVLSGAIVKAGLFGLILFTPEGALGPILMQFGLAGAFGAALLGLTQSNPKAVLAYSTISQMGLMIMLVGAGDAARGTAAYFALHHGLAKGALFLLVGVTMAARSLAQRIACLTVGACVAASLAGVPLTGGALAKAAAKEGLAEWASFALSVSSVATSLTLVWFLTRLWRMEPGDQAEFRAFRLALPAALGLAAFAGPWLLWSEWSGRGPAHAMTSEALTGALWPVAMALPPAAVILRWPLPQIPPGDLLLILGARRARTLQMPGLPPCRADADGVFRVLQEKVARLEKILIRLRLIGVVTLLLVLLLFALL